MTKLSTANSLLRWSMTVLFIGGALVLGYLFFRQSGGVNNFESCKAAGGTILESYPAQCGISGKVFVEEVAR